MFNFSQPTTTTTSTIFCYFRKIFIVTRHECVHESEEMRNNNKNTNMNEVE
jgi:hypothetical protein